MLSPALHPAEPRRGSTKEEFKDSISNKVFSLGHNQNKTNKMSSYRQLIYHLVFRTKGGRPTISQDHADQLYAYISGIVKLKESHLYRINGIENHLHILTDIHPSIALADFMKDIKVASSMWIKKSGYFPAFTGWSVGYGAFSCSFKDKDRLIEYIKSQQDHHSKKAFEDEYRKLLLDAGVNIDENYFP